MAASDQARNEQAPAKRPAWSFLHWLRIIAIGRNLKITLARMAALIAICWIVFKFILLPVRIVGISMAPTYKDHSLNLVNRLAYLRHPPRRGDVVSIRIAGTGVMYMKRIIGLPGETVAFVKGRPWIDGRLLYEPYLKFPCDWNQPPVQLKSDEFYLVGDNRSMPAVDHEHGAVKAYRIVGKVLL